MLKTEFGSSARATSTLSNPLSHLYNPFPGSLEAKRIVTAGERCMVRVTHRTGINIFSMSEYIHMYCTCTRRHTHFSPTPWGFQGWKYSLKHDEGSSTLLDLDSNEESIQHSVAHNKVQDVIVGEVSWSSRKTSTARKRMLSTVRRLADPGEHRVRKPALRAGGKRTHDQSPWRQ